MAGIESQLLGWLAAAMTLATFVCRDMLRLRLLALAANAAFIGYGTSAELLPVLALHLALVPVNLWRLSDAFGQASGVPTWALRARRLHTRLAALKLGWPGLVRSGAVARCPARAARPQ
jgi:hypothetical protein